jgi:ribosome maturation factor RimP
MAERDRAAGRAPARAGRGQSGRGPSPTGGSDLAAHRTRLRAVIGPVVTAAGLDLEDLTVSRAGRRHVLRVIVDGDNGVNLDTVADVSRAVSAALDTAEESGGSFGSAEYVLEVSSPGVDRPLLLPRHWRRNLGRLVSVRARDSQVTGRIVAVDDEVVALEIDGQVIEYEYPELGQGRVQVEFSRLDEIGDDDLDSYDEDEDDEDDGEFPEDGEFGSDDDPDDPDARREDGEQ